MSNHKNKKVKTRSKEDVCYPKFDKINGKHDLQNSCPDSFITYKVRRRKGGKVALFNFDLAKEMGLIPKNHPNELTPQLESAFLETFSLIIINEYDQINNIKYPARDILENEYMATRYLQLQHPNKMGKTSGDGRSIWNGQFKNKGRSWDISSCGTGATRLSPATHINKKFYQNGDPSISYGCGFSEKDEGLATLFFSEVFNKNGVASERLLGIIEYEKGLSINVRVHENLIRPSHMFNHLKQSNLQALENIVEYYIGRQEDNGRWTNVPKAKNERLNFFLDRQVEVFAKLSADFEDEYIFCWLDWDGDNILMDGSIIDFGSIRQFGLFHHEYRYDDVQRFSTTIKEQKNKAKHTVKTFIQLVEYLKSGVKRNINSYTNHKSLKRFEDIFEHKKNQNLVYKIGFNEKECEFLLKSHEKLITNFRKAFSYFERQKSKEGIQDVADGINWSAIFCMRDILRELPQILLNRGELLNEDEFIEILRSTYATDDDVELTPYRVEKIQDFQKYYTKLVEKCATYFSKERNEVLLHLTMRSSVINKYDRVTGDSITTIVDKVMRYRPKLKSDEIYNVLSEFVEHQNLNPNNKKKAMPNKDAKNKSLMTSIFKIVRDYREGL